MVTCPFCNNAVVALHRRSHLIPEWMYKDCYHDNHKMVKVNFSDEHVNKIQKGFYDEIICKRCEQESQQYDHYASLILTTRSPQCPEYRAIIRGPHKTAADRSETYSHWQNIDFHKLQRFVYGCVLRTHVHVQKHGGRLLLDEQFSKLLMIYGNTTLADDRSYPIMIIRYPNDDEFRDHVYLPFLNKWAGHHIIDLSGGGYRFWVFLSKHRKPDYVYSMRLKRDGSIYT